MKASTKQNFIIDAVMFLNMMALAGTGFLNRYVLLSGQKAKAVYGQNVDMYLLGMARERWESIHLYLGILLLGLLVLHIVLHWKQIVTIYRRLIQANKQRQLVLLVFVIVSIWLLIFPFILSPHIQIRENLNQGRGNRSYLWNGVVDNNLLTGCAYPDSGDFFMIT